MDDYICLKCSHIGTVEEFLVDSEIPHELVELFNETNHKYCCPNCMSVDIEPYEIS